jgi:hypothetical protein
MLSAPQTLPFAVRNGFNQGIFPMPSVPVSAAQKKPPSSASTNVAQKKPSDNPGKEAAPIQVMTGFGRPSASSVAADLQKELRQSFLKALYEKQEQSGETPCQGAAAASTSVSQEPPKKPLHQACSIIPAAVTAANNRGPPTPSQHNLPLPSDQKPPNGTAVGARPGQQMPAPAALNCLNVDRQGQQIIPAPAPPKQRPGKTTTTMPSANSTVKAFTTTDLPDFLSGFDQVANKSNGVAPTPVSIPRHGVWMNDQGVALSPVSISPRHGVWRNDQLQCSPPITSRSFDDMHRFLGKDSLQLGEASSLPKLTKATLHEAAKNEKTPDTGATFTAESYAMFAQESAMAASQHDAYLSHGFGPFVDANKSPAFDIDGMVRLLSEHMNHNHQDRLVGKAAKQHAMAAPHRNQASGNKRQPYDHTMGSTKPPATASTTSSTSETGRTSSPDFRIVSGSEPSDEQSSNGAMENGSSDSNVTDSLSSSNESEGNASDDSGYIHKRARGEAGKNSVSRSGAENNGGSYIDTSMATFEPDHLKRKRGRHTQN